MLQTRKDLLQAHRLMTKRAALALLQAEPDPPDQPLRRLNVATVCSVLIAAIVAAVFGIWGLLAPGNAGGLTAPGTLLIDQATGTPFVPCQHGKLCPVLNYASARLALNTTSPNQRDVSQASLSRYPRGPEIGIPGLPALPDPHMLVGQPWSVCVRTEVSSATQASHTVTTLVGGQRVGGRPMSASDALVVGVPGGQTWLVWNGERLLIPFPQRAAILTALNFVQAPVQVPLSWLDAFSRGQNFAPPVLPGFGRRVLHGPAGGPARIGQVFAVSPGGRQFYALTKLGLVPVTSTEARLLDAIGKVPQGTVTTAQAASHHGTMAADGMPFTMPNPADRNISPGAPLCVVYSASGQAGPVTGRVTVGGRVPSNSLATTGGTHVNQIAMKPGSAALVAVVPGMPGPSSAPTGRPDVTSYFLVTGGIRYGLASPSVASMLGYDLAAQQTMVPASVVDLIPAGPAFDPSQARTRVSG